MLEIVLDANIYGEVMKNHIDSIKKGYLIKEEIGYDEEGDFLFSFHITDKARTELSYLFDGSEKPSVKQTLSLKDIEEVVDSTFPKGLDDDKLTLFDFFKVA